MVEIIPKSSQSPPLFIRVLLSVSIGVFVIAVGGFVLLVFLGSRTQNTIEETELLLGTEKTTEQVRLEQDVFLAKARLQDFATLVQSRKDALPILLFLETVVHPDVTFLSMSVDTILHTTQLQGTAESFLALDEQLAVLQARAEPNSVSLTDLQLAKEGGVDFQMEIQFPTTFFQ